jgi:hypothetical protein
VVAGRCTRATSLSSCPASKHRRASLFRFRPIPTRPGT